ncbi:MAG: methyltransferase domain-containing protein [Sphingomonadales bacterium]|nr:methyltransferase domain-containing protein [Sphingomonadales bacterium]
MNWFESWFDSPWYPILYAQRDEEEAAAFIEKLLNRLQLSAGANILDLACGRGRHARRMAALGMSVTGVDLSEKSLADAKSQPMTNLHYHRHDMRHPLPNHKFDAVLNLFTSFGYFDDPDDDLRVIRSARSSLRAGGYLVIDYLNPNSVLPGLPTDEKIERSGVHFTLRRHYKHPWILKDITVEDSGSVHHFQEKVRYYLPSVLSGLLTSCGFEIRTHLGDYQLNRPHEQSPRAIFICQNPIQDSNSIPEA